MSSVTSLTAARMLEIEAASVVGGLINGSGHLILTKHDGSTIDAGAVLGSVPDASTTVKGIVELATSAEASALIDSARAVTPASLFPLFSDLDTRLDGIDSLLVTADTRLDGIDTSLISLDGRLDVIEALPGNKVQTISPPSSSASYSSYPSSVSIATLDALSGWSTPNGGLGSILTIQQGADRTVQMFYSNNGGTQTPSIYFRTYHSSGGGGGWTSWKQLALAETVPVVPTVFTASNASWPKPSGAKKFRIACLGGAGGGGAAAAAASGQHAKGGGGQAGGYSVSYVDASVFGSTIAVVVGAGGNGGSAGANPGSAGSPSSVGGTVVTAPGGNGGGAGSSSAASFATPGGSGGTTGTGDAATLGAPGGYGFGGATLGTGGYGASSLYGAGGVGANQVSSGGSTAGSPGTGYGSGGGGGCSSSGGAAAAGGAGRQGLVIIDTIY